MPLVLINPTLTKIVGSRSIPFQGISSMLPELTLHVIIPY